MDMILLDWTRMGHFFCLSGVIQQEGQVRVIRPLPGGGKGGPVRNVGWPHAFLAGRSRWEVFELVDPKPAEPRPPHLEDVWVGNLRSRGGLLSSEQRRFVLQATTLPGNYPLFGVPLTTNRTSAFLTPGTGERSLAGITVPVDKIVFQMGHRVGKADPDYRVILGVPGLEGRFLPVKDHFLLQRAELASPDLAGRLPALTHLVQQMGPIVAVRLGLSRPFQESSQPSSSVCYLMADSFFSCTNPQP